MNQGSKWDWNYMKSKSCYSPLVLFNFLAEAHSLIVLIGIDILGLILILTYDIDIWYMLLMILVVIDILRWLLQVTPNLLRRLLLGQGFPKITKYGRMLQIYIKSIHSYEPQHVNYKTMWLYIYFWPAPLCMVHALADKVCTHSVDLKF